MFLELVSYLYQLDSGFSVLRYLSVRSLFATLTALILSLLLGNFFIKTLKSYQIKQVVRYDGPSSHFSKSGTPTMGGLLILITFSLSTLMWADWHNAYIWVILITALLFASIGFLDDVLMIKRKSSKGLSAKQKYFAQSLAALIIVFYLFYLGDGQHLIIIPFIKETYIYLGLTGFIILTYFVIVGSSNAVNLTDGLDGLAIMPVMLITTMFGVLAYLSSHYEFANYLNIPHLNYSGEIVIICSALIGSSLGFLWFNAYPAEVFMGDVGSLALGAILAVIAISLHQELLLPIAGGVFVLEAVSVMLQVGSFKLRQGKRIFLMAPIHHHFEKKGLSEPKIIARFWMVTIILVIISLASLKIR